MKIAHNSTRVTKALWAANIAKREVAACNEACPHDGYHAGRPCCDALDTAIYRLSVAITELDRARRQEAK